MRTVWSSTVALRDIFVRNVAPYKEAGRLRLVRENGRPLRGFRFIPTSGHSPGHSGIEFTSQGKRLIFIGDAFISKVRIHTDTNGRRRFM